MFIRDVNTETQISKICHRSTSSVRRTVYEYVPKQYRLAVLPKHLSFDEFRSTGHAMSFICYDSENHEIVAKLNDRLSSSIIEYFFKRIDCCKHTITRRI